MADEKIKVGLIGAGGIANYHARAYEAMEDVELVAVCDIVEDRAREFSGRYNVPKIYTDYKELLAKEEVDAIDICTSNDMHYPVAMEAIKAGRHIFCEKPLGMNYEETKEMFKGAEKAGLKTAVNFSYRTVPAVIMAKNIIDSGELGRIYHVQGSYWQSWGPNPLVPKMWRLDKSRTGTGVLGDLGSHLIDLCRFLIGEIDEAVGKDRTFITKRFPFDPSQKQPPFFFRKRDREAEKELSEEKMVDVDVDDAYALVVNYANSALGTLMVSRFASGRINYQRIEIYGDKGSMVYELEREGEVWVSLGDFMLSNHQFTKVEIPGMLAEMKINNGRLFIDSLRDRKETHPVLTFLNLEAPTFYDGMKGQAVIEAAVLSVQERRWVKLEEIE